MDVKRYLITIAKFLCFSTLFGSMCWTLADTSSSRLWPIIMKKFWLYDQKETNWTKFSYYWWLKHQTLNSKGLLQLCWCRIKSYFLGWHSAMLYFNLFCSSHMSNCLISWFYRCGRYPPEVRTAIPVDGRFEHIVLSCNATSDHGIIWIEREAQKALEVSGT